MDENPYQPPQSPSNIRPGHKALVGLSVLSLLSVPASAIAGSTVCTDLTVLHRTGPVAIMLGILCCLAMVVGALAVEEKARTAASWREIKPVLAAVAYFQVIALPFALAIGFLGGVIGYGFLAHSIAQRNEWLISWSIGSAANLAWSSAAYYAWRDWFRKKAEKEPRIEL